MSEYEEAPHVEDDERAEPGEGDNLQPGPADNPVPTVAPGDDSAASNEPHETRERSGSSKAAGVATPWPTELSAAAAPNCASKTAPLVGEGCLQHRRPDHSGGGAGSAARLAAWKPYGGTRW